MKVSSKVPAAYKNLPVADYLAQRFPYLSLAMWQERVAEGRIWHNGRCCSPGAIVAQGDVIAYDMPDFTPPANLDYDILYLDEWLLGINKPAGLHVHARGKFVQSNLIYHLRHLHQPSFPEADLVNRLDAPTSGVVVAARDKATLRLMHQLFATQAVAKTYLAIVTGIPNPPVGTIAWPIGRVSQARFGVGALPGAKEARTDYRVQRPLGPHHALLQLTPHTGRTHQLRVHLATLGHPIVGDWLYGGETAPRLALHCAQTRFSHPHTGQLCAIIAPIPADFQMLIKP